MGYGVRTRGISRAPFRFLFLACTSMLKIEESTAHQQHHDSDRNTPTQISKEPASRCGAANRRRRLVTYALTNWCRACAPGRGSLRVATVPTAEFQSTKVTIRNPRTRASTARLPRIICQVFRSSVLSRTIMPGPRAAVVIPACAGVHVGRCRPRQTQFPAAVRALVYVKARFTVGDELNSLDCHFPAALTGGELDGLRFQWAFNN